MVGRCGVLNQTMQDITICSPSVPKVLCELTGCQWKGHMNERATNHNSGNIQQQVNPMSANYTYPESAS